jgi:hypothetical protein
MRASFGILFLVLILALLSTVRADDSATSVCPIVSEGETALDCPWAMIARQVAPILAADSNPSTAAPKIEHLLSEIAPDFLARIEREGKIAKKAKGLWGRSINFDENAKGIIIPPALIDVVLAKAGVPAREDRIVYAGFEHTYGYLLSILKTPYGYKRLRWVRPDIENGFGLEKGAISPAPKDGGLFMNVTYFAGRIAFRASNDQDRAALKILRRGDGAARSLRRFDFRTLHGRRLTETVALGDGRTVEIRTDFVPFTKGSGDATGGNTELLVYSMRDSATKLPYLISAFPIAKGFSDGALNPANLGEGKPVVTKYNAFVPGLTDSKSPLTGKREASTF